MKWWRAVRLPILVEIALAVLTVVASQKKRRRTERQWSGHLVRADGCPGFPSCMSVAQTGGILADREARARDRKA
jgi:hypothetical protein